MQKWRVGLEWKEHAGDPWYRAQIILCWNLSSLIVGNIYYLFFKSEVLLGVKDGK